MTAPYKFKRTLNVKNKMVAHDLLYKYDWKESRGDKVIMKLSKTAGKMKSVNQRRLLSFEIWFSEL